MAEGCGQLLQFFLLYMGLHTTTSDARFQPILELPQKVRCRGQVKPQIGELIYRLEVKEIGLSPQPYAIADIDIILNGRIVVDFKDLGVRIVEKKKDDQYALSSDAINEIIKNNPGSKGTDLKSVPLGTGSLSLGTDFKSVPLPFLD